MRLSLTSSIFEQLKNAKCAYAFLGNSLYIESGQGEVVWTSPREKKTFELSEQLQQFNSERLDENHKQIEEYISFAAAFKYGRKANSDNIFQLERNATIQDIVNKVNIRSQGRASSQPMYIPQFTFSDIHKQPIKTPAILSKPGVCSDGINGYRLSRNVEGEERITINGISFSLENQFSLDKLITQYDISMLSAIEQVAKRISQNILPMPLQVNGKIKYHQLEENDFTIFEEIDPFISKINNLYYAFEGNHTNKKIRAGFSVSINNNVLTLNHSPQILDMPFHHPFVYESGSICFDGDRRWIDNNITFGRPYKLGEDNIVEKIFRIFNQTKFNLTQGYYGDLTPVNRIESFNPVARNKMDAKTYALQKGYDVRKIFEG